MAPLRACANMAQMGANHSVSVTSRFGNRFCSVRITDRLDPVTAVLLWGNYMPFPIERQEYEEPALGWR